MAKEEAERIAKEEAEVKEKLENKFQVEPQTKDGKAKETEVTKEMLRVVEYLMEGTSFFELLGEGEFPVELKYVEQLLTEAGSLEQALDQLHHLDSCGCQFSNLAEIITALSRVRSGAGPALLIQQEWRDSIRASLLELLILPPELSSAADDAQLDRLLVEGCGSVRTQRTLSMLALHSKTFATFEALTSYVAYRAHIPPLQVTEDMRDIVLDHLSSSCSAMTGGGDVTCGDMDDLLVWCWGPTACVVLLKRLHAAGKRFESFQAMARAVPYIPVPSEDDRCRLRDALQTHLTSGEGQNECKRAAREALNEMLAIASVEEAIAVIEKGKLDHATTTQDFLKLFLH